MTKKDKNTRILEAAFALFSEKGYNNTKIVDIATRAGIGKGTVYEYYDSKEDLFIIAIVERVKTEFARMAESVREYDTATERLKAFLTFEAGLLEKYGSDTSEFRAQLGESNVQVSARMKEAVSDIFILEYIVMSGIIRKGIESGEFRDVNVTLAAGLASSAISTYCMFKYNLLPLCDCTNKVIPFDEVEDCKLDDIFDMVLKGISKQ